MLQSVYLLNAALWSTVEPWLNNPVTRFLGSDEMMGVYASGTPGIPLDDLGGMTFAGMARFAKAGKLEATARYYSVAFETTITKAGVGKRASHFAEANRNLAETMAKDSQFAKMVDSLGIKIPQRLEQSPANWTWHHVTDQPGVLQLVPRVQHQGAQWQSLLHPNQTGGFKLWGSNY